MNLKVKIFEGNTEGVQDDFNWWLAEHPAATIHQIVPAMQIVGSYDIQSFAIPQAHLVLTVLYSENSESHTGPLERVRSQINHLLAQAEGGD